MRIRVLSVQCRIYTAHDMHNNITHTTHDRTIIQAQCVYPQLFFADPIADGPHNLVSHAAANQRSEDDDAQTRGDHDVVVRPMEVQSQREGHCAAEAAREDDELHVER